MVQKENVVHVFTYDITSNTLHPHHHVLARIPKDMSHNVSLMYFQHPGVNNKKTLEIQFRNNICIMQVTNRNWFLGGYQVIT